MKWPRRRRSRKGRMITKKRAEVWWCYSYVKDVSERLRKNFKRRWISTAMRPHMTLSRLLVRPKDKMAPRDSIYTIDCNSCEGKYIGLLKNRVNRHRDEVETESENMPFTRGEQKGLGGRKMEIGHNT